MSVLEIEKQILPMKTDVLVFTKTRRRSLVDCAKQRRCGVAIMMMMMIIIIITIHGQHHPKADIDLLYVPRKQGGRGLMQLEAVHAVEITKFVEYVDRKEEPLMQGVRTHQHNTDSARCLKTEVQKETRKMKDSIAEKTKER